MSNRIIFLYSIFLEGGGGDLWHQIKKDHSYCLEGDP